MRSLVRLSGYSRIAPIAVMASFLIALASCGESEPAATNTPSVDADATVQAAIDATISAAPTSTPTTVPINTPLPFTPTIEPATPTSQPTLIPPVTATASPTQAPTSTPAPDANPGDTSVVRLFAYLEGMYADGYVGPYRSSATIQIGGVEEHLFRYEDGNAMTPELVEAWSVDAFGTELTLVLRQGIKWQSPRGFEETDFGEFNAAELVEWFNRLNATTNPSSTNGKAGDLAAIFLEARATSEYTVKIGLVSPIFFCFPISQFGCLSAARGPQKVTTVDSHGVVWARAHHVGTGPFVQGNCTVRDTCTVHAVENHWRKTAEVGEITGVHVPEAVTQIAMMNVGIADLAQIDYELLDAFEGTDIRFIETMPGGFIGQSIIFSGNLWEETHSRTGQPLEPWDSGVYDTDRAWLGDPWQQSHPQNVRYTDVNNPSGMTDMEQARLVRLALSTAIDRSALDVTYLDGLGIPLYSEYMGPQYPGWDPSEQTSCYDVDGNVIACLGTSQPVDWELDDGDLAAAGALLDAAGYPLVNGVRQGFGQLALQSYPAEAGPVSVKVAQGITATWAQLGIEIISVPEDYASVISPRMREREQYWPILKNGDIHSNVWPLDWPMPTTDTSSTRPGWGVGFESPATASWLFQILSESDKGAREALHLKWVDYSLFWVQYAGVFQLPKGIVAGPRIDSWNGYQRHYSNTAGNPEFIVIAD